MSTTSQERFEKVIYPQVKKELGFKNMMEVPRLRKIVVNVGIGSRFTRSKDFSDVLDNITAITGQKPVVHHAKKAISNFKLREGTPNGVTVTLRGKRMYDFFSRLLHVALPRMRDFQGVSPKGFDRKGNYSLGLKDISVFPEVVQDDLAHLHGLEITLVTTAKNDDAARALFAACHFPFKKAVVSETPGVSAVSAEAVAKSEPVA